MELYFVNKVAQDNGDHEVNRLDCSYLPTPQNRIDLGRHGHCESAIQLGKDYISPVNGCYYCCRACHTS